MDGVHYLYFSRLLFASLCKFVNLDPNEFKKCLFIDNHSLSSLAHDQTTQTIQATMQYEVNSEKRDREMRQFFGTNQGSPGLQCRPAEDKLGFTSSARCLHCHEVLAQSCRARSIHARQGSIIKSVSANN